VQIDMTGIKSVLIVKLSSIGDVIHALPVAAALKRTYPDIKLSWLVEAKCADVVNGNPYVDEVIPFPRHNWKGKRLKWRTWIEAARFAKIIAKRFDLTLDLQGLLKSAILARISSHKTYSYHWQREGARLFAKPIPRQTNSLHIVDQYLDIPLACGAKIEPIEFAFYISPTDEECAITKLREIGIEEQDRFIAINPSAGQPFKRWKPEKFALLSDRIEEMCLGKAVFVGGPGDVEIEEQIASLKKRLMRSLIGKTSLKELAAVLKHCNVHICGDTGSGHIAVAVGSTCIGIYGPTDPDRSGPYLQRSNVLCKRDPDEIKQLNAAKDGPSADLVTVDEVWDMLVSLMGVGHACT
jgi:heptosyltransferase-1